MATGTLSADAAEAQETDAALEQTRAPATYAFQLRTITDELIIVDPDNSNAVTVVCFLGTECPLIQLYSHRLTVMANEYRSKGVRFIGVNSNIQDTPEDIRAFLQKHELSFPLVRDDDHAVADQYGAVRTPEVFVLDRHLKLQYQGRIDDQYAPGVARPSASRPDLRAAIDELLAGKTVSVPKTTAVGCIIGKRRSRDRSQATSDMAVTWCNQVTRVLQKHCLECHRPGEIGPFSMETLDDVAGWAETMLETIDDGRMPPWHADPQYGHFKNARLMPEADKKILRDWVAAGKPKGNEADLPPKAEFPQGWQLSREPDLVVPMRNKPYSIPAEGTVEYQYFVVDPGFTEDRWMTAAQVIPGNRTVVHHAIVFIRPPDGTPFRGVGWLTAYVPGQRTVEMPSGHGRRIPAGSKLVFQMHYTTNGSPQQDMTQVGLLFGQEDQMTHEVITVVGIDQEFEIPPNTPAHEVSGDVRWFPREGRLLAVAPHMHLRGKQFRLSAERDGASEMLLNVPRYDFNWQHAYEFSVAPDLSTIDRLRFTVTFDNSSENPFNPDPSQWVTWGDQTWEEMAVAFFEVAEPRKKNSAASSAPARPSETGSTNASGTVATGDQAADVEAAREKKIEQFVADFFARLDTNGDNIVLQSEAPVAVRSRFGRFDQNGDKKATREEVRTVAEERFPR